MSRNQRFKNLKFNILHRAYLTPAWLKRFFPVTQFDCPRCHTPEAPFMFWTCPTLQDFWTTVHTTLQTVTGMAGLTTWEACTLGIFKRHNQRKVETRFAVLAILLAK